MQSVTPEHFKNIDVAFFTALPEFTRARWQMAKAAGAAIVDLSYALEEQPGARLRAPWIEHELGTAPAAELEPGPVVVAHPAAVAVGLLLLRAAKVGAVRTAAVTILEPASERGRRGMDELHEQTVNLLSFQKLPTEVFGTQVAFNLVARYGEESQPALESIEHRIRQHIRRLAAGRAFLPALSLLQAPIFHGHVFSLYLEMQEAVTEAGLSHALAGEHVALMRPGDDPPSNVAAAGQEQVQVWLRRDPDRDHAFWIWAAADNLRVMALNAVECAEQLVMARPKGKIQ